MASTAFLPTPRSAILAVVAAPLALLVAAIWPGAWVAVPAAAIALLALTVLDALTAGRVTDATFIAPPDCEVGEPLEVAVRVSATRLANIRKPQVALAFDDRLAPGGRASFTLSENPEPGILAGHCELVPGRRGTAEFERVWIGWEGPLGLARWHRKAALDTAVRVWPDLAPVRSPALQNFLRDAQFGLIARRIRGDGSQFESLTEYESGMDRRRIDWKSSARHARLNAREYEAERDNQIVFAFDCGKAMCDPVDGLPRIDRAVSAALTSTFVALKGGDRVALFGFASRPQVMTPFFSGSRSFGRIQSAAAGLDYTSEEPNFTLALATLATKLQRRSLVVLFSEFADPTGAELMIENVSRLVTRHRVIVVTIEDSELAELADAEPGSVADIAGAVAADTLSRQRAVVLQRLRHLGVDVVEAPWRSITFALLDRYLSIKQGMGIG